MRSDAREARSLRVEPAVAWTGAQAWIVTVVYVCQPPPHFGLHTLTSPPPAPPRRLRPLPRLPPSAAGRRLVDTSLASCKRLTPRRRCTGTAARSALSGGRKGRRRMQAGASVAVLWANALAKGAAPNNKRKNKHRHSTQCERGSVHCYGQEMQHARWADTWLRRLWGK